MAVQNEVATVERQVSVVCKNVLTRASKMQEANVLMLPKNYALGNAIKGAEFVLSELKTRDGKYALEVCSQASIENSLLKMVKNGLDVNKNQCYFIPYGKELQLMISYMGKEAIAKRVADVKEIKAFVVYEGDEFEYGFDEESFTMKVTKYVPHAKNVDISKVVGCFGVAIFNDGSKSDVTYMTLAQIKKAWMQGAAKGNSGAHNNFTDEMCKKTVKGRICKELINTSDDADLIEDTEEKDFSSENEQKEMTASKDFEEPIETTATEAPAEQPKQQAEPAQHKATPEEVAKAIDDDCPL